MGACPTPAGACSAFVRCSLYRYSRTPLAPTARHDRACLHRAEDRPAEPEEQRERLHGDGDHTHPAHAQCDPDRQAAAEEHHVRERRNALWQRAARAFQPRAIGGTRSVQCLHEEIWRDRGVTGRTKATIRAEDDEADQGRHHAHAQHECVPLLVLMGRIHRAASFLKRQYRPSWPSPIHTQKCCTDGNRVCASRVAARYGGPVYVREIHACGLYNKTRVALL